jgi:hypothetical protein
VRAHQPSLPYNTPQQFALATSSKKYAASPARALAPTPAATSTKVVLSASSRGRPIKVDRTDQEVKAALASPWETDRRAAYKTTTTLIHAIEGLDEIWLYAYNTASDGVTLTVGFGVEVVEDALTLTIPARSGLTLVVPGLILTKDKDQGKDKVWAYASQKNVVMILGYVHRIS